MWGRSAGRVLASAASSTSSSQHQRTTRALAQDSTRLIGLSIAPLAARSAAVSFAWRGRSLSSTASDRPAGGDEPSGARAAGSTIEDNTSGSTPSSASSSTTTGLGSVASKRAARLQRSLRTVQLKGVDREVFSASGLAKSATALHRKRHDALYQRRPMTNEDPAEAERQFDELMKSTNLSEEDQVFLNELYEELGEIEEKPLGFMDEWANDEDERAAAEAKALEEEEADEAAAASPKVAVAERAPYELKGPERYSLASGRRKTSKANVKCHFVGDQDTLSYSEDATFLVNDGKTLAEYFFYDDERVADVLSPLEVLGLIGKVQVRARVSGGGLSGQAGALRMGLARALLLQEPKYKVVLKLAGFLKRDPRMVERQKPGQRGARAKFQWSKR